jgi:PAS domain S-box-containing protein
MMIGTEFLSALPAAVYLTDADGQITFFNDAAARLWGRCPPLGDQWCGAWRLYWPDGRPLPHDECPMAVALKEGRPAHGIEAVAKRPDGTQVHFLAYPTPLRDASGRITGAINLLVDVTERRKADLESAKLAAIVASSDDAIISKTLEGRITSWNAAATRIFGYQADEMIGQSITQIIPPALHGDEQDILARLRRGEHIDHFETVRVTKDGRLVDMSLTVSPLYDKSGTVIGASKVGRDITERKQADKFQHLLMDELNHRVKNTLAIIQAIANQSLRRATNAAEFVSSFTGRVKALARAHDVLTQTKLQGADLVDIVREQVLIDAAGDNRISCSGPSLVLDAQTAMHLALVLHELATNARKYGALSVPTGRLSVTWEIRGSGEFNNLVLDWKESGGPKVSAPKQRGFGSTLIERTLSAHGGEVAMSYRAEGMSSRMTLPLPRQVRASFDRFTAKLQGERNASLLPEESAKSSLSGRRMIIIEDEPLVTMDLESILTAAGCSVVGSAGTIDLAKRLVEHIECDAAILDMNLAGEHVDELATDLTRKHIPFVFVTGYGQDGLSGKFRHAIVLKKPVSRDQLLATLETLFPQTVAVRQLRPKGR